MWVIIGFIVIVGVIVVVMNRRGSTGASRADDLPSSRAPRRPRRQRLHQPGRRRGRGGGGF